MPSSRSQKTQRCFAPFCLYHWIYELQIIFIYIYIFLLFIFQVHQQAPPKPCPMKMGTICSPIHGEKMSMRSNLTTFHPPCGCGIYFIDSLGRHEKVGTLWWTGSSHYVMEVTWGISCATTNCSYSVHRL